MPRIKSAISAYWMLFIAAFAVSVALTLAIVGFLSPSTGRVVEAEEGNWVVVATGYFDIATVLTAEDVDLIKIFSPPSDDAVREVAEVVGKIALGRIEKGQIILDRHITSDASLFEGHSRLPLPRK